ncbi:MAG: DUF1353 domain-containing protein [Paracoccaceae bacterium]
MSNYRFFLPTVPNPYPGGDVEVDGFEYLTRLVLAREPEALLDKSRRKVSYVVAEPYTVAFAVNGERRVLTVPKGMLTDLASVPRGARNIVGRVGPHLEAAIVHDYLFNAWQLVEGQGARREDYKFANAVMFAGLRSAQVHWFERTAIQVALTIPPFSWNAYQSPDEVLFVELDERFAASETGTVGPEIEVA